VSDTLWVIMRPGRRRGVEVLYYLGRAAAEAKLNELNASLLQGVETELFYLEERVLGDALVESRPPRFNGEPRRRGKRRVDDSEDMED